MTQEEKQIVGKVYDIQGFSVHDGPGIRTTVFLKGCPLRCKWCHSPESQAYYDQLCRFELRCIGVENCGLCIDACPKGAMAPGERCFSDAQGAELQYVNIDRSKCTDCGLCVKACPSRALFMSGTDYTVQEIIDRVMKDASYFKRNGGGVTISGGECLTQPDFTLALLKGLKERGVHTAVDTTGYVRYEILERTLPYTDLYLYDLKHMSSQKHMEGTGVTCELILENAKRLAAAGGKLQIRIPVIPGYNDSEDNLKTARDFCAELEKNNPGSVTVVQLLPYHKLGTMKYVRLGIPYPMDDVEPPSEDYMQELRRRFCEAGLNCIVH